MDDKTETQDLEVLSTENTYKIPNDIANTKLRFFFLFVSCVAGIGSCFCYDNPGALEEPLIEVKEI
jgi:hypothetical protein